MARLLELAGWKRILVTALCLMVWRLLDFIPVSGLNAGYLASRTDYIPPPGILGAIGYNPPITSISVGLMGIKPYINAVIVIALISVISGSVRTMWTTGPGRLRLTRWTRAAAIVFALGSAYGWIKVLQSENALPASLDGSARIVLILELTAGSVIVILLAGLLDEFGLGFGVGAFLIYALGTVATEAHRLAAIVASAPSIEALYRPLGIKIAFSVAAVAIIVAVLLAIRPLPPPAENSEGVKPLRLRLLMSGVFLPVAVGQLIVFLPSAVAMTYPQTAAWVTYNWSPFGVNPWWAAAYVAMNALCIVVLAVFIVAAEWRGTVDHRVVAHAIRLSVIGGAVLALVVAVMPILEEKFSRAAGQLIPMSGFDTVLIAAIIVAAVNSLEHPKRKVSAAQAALEPRLI